GPVTAGAVVPNEECFSFDGVAVHRLGRPAFSAGLDERDDLPLGLFREVFKSRHVGAGHPVLDRVEGVRVAVAVPQPPARQVRPTGPGAVGTVAAGAERADHHVSFLNILGAGMGVFLDRFGGKRQGTEEERATKAEETAGKHESVLPSSWAETGYQLMSTIDD